VGRIEAKLRYQEIIKNKTRKRESLKREEIRKTSEEIQRKNEAKVLQKRTVIQTLVTEFTDAYEKEKKPVSWQEIHQKAKSSGLHGPDAYLEVAVKLEETGVLTGYYVKGKIDPTWEPPPKILHARKNRKVKP